MPAFSLLTISSIIEASGPSDGPAGIVRFTEIRVIADVVACPRLVDVRPLHLDPAVLLRERERFED